MSGPADHLTETLPAWARPNEDAPVGVDFLGTRQANLDMLRELTGVYNNQVRSARQHAILAWAAWRFAENVKDREAVRPSEFLAFLEAIETIQLVGQHEVADEVGAARGGLGSGSYQHLPKDGPIPLAFADYRRTRQTSALAAVQYGPSARTAGLGFLADAAGIAVASRERGQELARTLDSQLRRSAHYSALTRHPLPATLPRAAVLDLARHGIVIPSADGAPRPERAAYVTALFSLDGRTPGDRRPQTLALLLDTLLRLGADEEAGEHDLRAHFLAWRGGDQNVPRPLAETLRRWQVFQVRQLQRFAMESWLALAERWMDAGISSPSGMVDEVADSLTSEDDLAELLSEPAGRALEHWPDPLAWAEDRGPWALVWETIGPALRAGDGATAVAGTLRLFLGTLALANQVVPASGDLRLFAATGGRPRLALPEAQRWWTRRARWKLREVLTELIEEQVLQQHVGVAVSRFDNNRRRLRFSPGEEGWTLLPGTSPSTPGLTPDRIGAALALLADLDLVRRVDDGDRYEPAYEVTEEGRDVLERVLRVGATEPASANT